MKTASCRPWRWSIRSPATSFPPSSSPIGRCAGLPKVIVAEEKCTLEDAIERSVEIHNELMHTFVEEAAVLSQLGSFALRRFLADIWAWLGGNREWHSTTERYHGSSKE
jgi:hypothetical protein